MNPGGLPKGLTLKKFGSVSIRRNEIIADLFSRLNKVERLGSGIRKMRKAMANARLPEPEFDPNGSFAALFRRSPEFALKQTGFETTQSTGMETGKKTRVKTGKKTGDRILDLMRANSEITATEMAEALGLSANGVRWNIARLKADGVLHRVGPDKGGHWEIKTDSEGGEA